MTSSEMNEYVKDWTPMVITWQYLGKFAEHLEANKLKGYDWTILPNGFRVDIEDADWAVFSPSAAPIPTKNTPMTILFRDHNQAILQKLSFEF